MLTSLPVLQLSLVAETESVVAEKLSANHFETYPDLQQVCIEH
jgi:hypothetical protein